MWVKVAKDTYTNDLGFALKLDSVEGWKITHELLDSDLPGYFLSIKDAVYNTREKPVRFPVKNATVQNILGDIALSDLFIISSYHELKRIPANVSDIAIIRNTDKSLQKLYILAGQNAHFLTSWRDLTLNGLDWQEIQNIPAGVSANANLGGYADFLNKFEENLL